MKDLTTKGLGGTSRIAGLFNIGKTNKAQGSNKIGAIKMTGVYAGNDSLSVKPKSTFVVPQEIVDKYADVVAPKGKAPQLVIADADYMPDKEYADLEY